VLQNNSVLLQVTTVDYVDKAVENWFVELGSLCTRVCHFSMRIKRVQCDNTLALVKSQLQLIG